MERDKDKSANDGLDTFRKWLTPILIVLIGYLSSKKMDDIDKKLDLVNVVQASQAVLNNEVTNNKDRLNKVEGRVDNIEQKDREVLYTEAEKRLKRR